MHTLTVKANNGGVTATAKVSVTNSSGLSKTDTLYVNIVSDENFFSSENNINNYYIIGGIIIVFLAVGGIIWYNKKKNKNKIKNI